MPLVEHIQLPSFERLRQRGQEILSLDRALAQDIRELHIGLLNMMPDAALQVTEQQFMRLVGSSNKIAQFYVHPFSVSGLARSTTTQAYIDKYYSTFDEIRAEGLDALIITGANVANPLLEQEPFWEPLTQVIEWASEKVTSVLCSCLSTHALMKHIYGINRQPLEDKMWGVYSHRITAPQHPLLRDVNTRFDAPHSRHNAITREQLEAAGLSILIESQEAGVHMVVSPDQFRSVYFQGHPEYDTNSLLKEYKREVRHFLNHERELPPYPANYFPPEAQAICERYIEQAQKARHNGSAPPVFPEAEILPYLDNTWGDTGKALFNNWLGLVYQLTHVERHKLFIEGVDPQNPLGLL
ncbi:MAG: homoserine O-succinyltransferase [Anaerolineae bacterium]|nr:homoserine O-succinyltransferase [Anaerolineae bacterium]